MPRIKNIMTEDEEEDTKRKIELAETIKVIFKYYRERFIESLEDKLETQRVEISQNSRKWDEYLTHKENLEHKRRLARKPQMKRMELKHDQNFLDYVGKSRFYQIVKLKNQYIKQGKIKTHAEEEQFWELVLGKTNNPIDELMRKDDIVLQMKEFKSEKSEKSATENRWQRISRRALIFDQTEKTRAKLEEIALHKSLKEESSEEMDSVGKLPNVLKFPTQAKRRASHISKMSTKPDKNDIESLFPKLEQPKFNIISIDISQATQDKLNLELVKERNKLQELENLRAKYRLKNAYEVAIINKATSSRLLESKSSPREMHAPSEITISDYFNESCKQQNHNSSIKPRSSYSHRLHHNQEKMQGYKSISPPKSAPAKAITASLRRAAAVSEKAFHTNCEETPSELNEPLSFSTLCANNKVKVGHGTNEFWINYATSATN